MSEKPASEPVTEPRPTVECALEGCGERLLDVFRESSPAFRATVDRTGYEQFCSTEHRDRHEAGASGGNRENGPLSEDHIARHDREAEVRPVSAGALEAVVGSVIDSPLNDLLEQEEIDRVAADIAEKLLGEFTVTRTLRRG